MKKPQSFFDEANKKESQQHNEKAQNCFLSIQIVNRFYANPILQIMKNVTISYNY